MKHLQDILQEGLLDVDMKNNPNFKDVIKKFLRENYKGSASCKISRQPNSDGKYVVDPKGNIEVKNPHMDSLTNGLFIFGEAEKDFICSNCRSLTSLEGAPKVVGGFFMCENCVSLISLEGAPKIVGGIFSCVGCKLLTSLEGAPEEVGSHFLCRDCTSLTSLEGAPKKVKSWFDCSNCTSLTSLEGAEDTEAGYFDCLDCNSLTSLKGAPKLKEGVMHVPPHLK